jgi:hypothetical protein
MDMKEEDVSDDDNGEGPWLNLKLSF